MWPWVLVVATLQTRPSRTCRRTCLQQWKVQVRSRRCANELVSPPQSALQNELLRSRLASNCAECSPYQTRSCAAHNVAELLKLNSVLSCGALCISRYGISRAALSAVVFLFDFTNINLPMYILPSVFIWKHQSVFNELKFLQTSFKHQLYKQVQVSWKFQPIELSFETVRHWSWIFNLD